MTLVYDLDTGYVRVAQFVLWMLSFGTLHTRPTWLIKPGEPVWRLEP